GEEAETGDATPEDVLVHRREKIVDGVPEHVEEPRRRDGRDRDEEAGDEPNLEPVAETPGHTRAMRPHGSGGVKKLSGRVALVTGGAVRVGRAIALALAREGADVAIGYLSSAGEARATVRDLRALGVRAVALRADVGRPADARRLVTQAVARLG